MDWLDVQVLLRLLANSPEPLCVDPQSLSRLIRRVMCFLLVLWLKVSVNYDRVCLHQ
jgi:hypothetical protein